MSASFKKAQNPDARSFTSGKLDILDGLASDPRVSDREFRMAFRVAQAMKAETGLAIIGDETVCDEVLFTPKEKARWFCNDTRKHLTEIGWWTVIRGHGRRASRYRFLDENVELVRQQRQLDREARAAERERRQGEGHSKSSTRKPAGDLAPRDVEVAPEPHNPSQGMWPGNHREVAGQPPVHLRSPSQERSKNDECRASTPAREREGADSGSDPVGVFWPRGEERANRDHGPDDLRGTPPYRAPYVRFWSESENSVDPHIGPTGKASLLEAARRVLNRPDADVDGIHRAICRLDVDRIDRLLQGRRLTLDLLADAFWAAGVAQQTPREALDQRAGA